MSLEDDLLTRLVDCGKVAHDIGRAHHNDPGSNGHTFGLDRYQRATELARNPLEDHGFQVTRRGAGLIARRGDLVVQFAVARGDDLTDPADFDADSSPARRRAGHTNAGQQLTLDGMPAQETVVHVVWSGNPTDGQTAVHVGRLLMSSRTVERLTWETLIRVDQPTPPAGGREEPTRGALPSYLEQPEPTLELVTASPKSRSDAR